MPNCTFFGPCRTSFPVGLIDSPGCWQMPRMESKMLEPRCRVVHSTVSCSRFKGFEWFSCDSNVNGNRFGTHLVLWSRVPWMLYLWASHPFDPALQRITGNNKFRWNKWLGFSCAEDLVSSRISYLATKFGRDWCGHVATAFRRPGLLAGGGCGGGGGHRSHLRRHGQRHEGRSGPPWALYLLNSRWCRCVLMQCTPGGHLHPGVAFCQRGFQSFQWQLWHMTWRIGLQVSRTEIKMTVSQRCSLVYFITLHSSPNWASWSGILGIQQTNWGWCGFSLLSPFMVCYWDGDYGIDWHPLFSLSCDDPNYHPRNSKVPYQRFIFAETTGWFNPNQYTIKIFKHVTYQYNYYI